MKPFPDSRIVDRIRRDFPAGCRVELVRMDDAQAPPIGTEGTVIGVDDVGSVMVDWDNGSGLNVIYGEDICRKICPECGRPYNEPPALSRRDNRTQICPECGMREAGEDWKQALKREGVERLWQK